MTGILKAHFSLNVRDVDASVAFYAKAFGVEPLKRRPRYAKFDLVTPALNLALVEKPPTGHNVNHFGIQVASSGDVAQAKARFESLGLEVLEEQEVACCYAVQDKVWITDPDGNRWEVFTVLGEADRLETSNGACCLEAAPSTCTTADTCVTQTAATGSCGCS